VGKRGEQSVRAQTGRHLECSGEEGSRVLSEEPKYESGWDRPTDRVRREENERCLCLCLRRSFLRPSVRPSVCQPLDPRAKKQGRPARYSEKEKRADQPSIPSSHPPRSIPPCQLAKKKKKVYYCARSLSFSCVFFYSSFLLFLLFFFFFSSLLLPLSTHPPSLLPTPAAITMSLSAFSARLFPTMRQQAVARLAAPSSTFARFYTSMFGLDF